MSQPNQAAQSTDGALGDQNGDQARAALERALSWALVKALERGDVELAENVAAEIERLTDH